MYLYRNRHGTGISVRCMRPYDEYRQFTPNPEGGVRSNATLFDNRQQKRTANANGDTEAGALMFGSLYFDKVPTGCQVSNAGTDVFCVYVWCVCVCVRACARARACDHFNCFLIAAESTLNTYCLINNHCIKICFYLCTLTMKTKQIIYI